MKRPSAVVALVGLIGLVLGVILGFNVSGSCTADFVPEGGTCYRYFGRYFSDRTYYVVNLGLWGLGAGLVLGLLIVTVRWLSLRHAPSN